ncbi:MAG: pentapeptide repeat-containing protein [Paludisphaera borealis]|uniref:pentapeptide repeat-containing protein n=1 Tax=Paludisphaera borealis TaxID=1387353 RepID=UPI00283B0FC8|nr:pentapeptide repeat-containing protein [Paludisphaera borealis]MDR3621593.1 pentapeptide repeat-containing protein [Paludisphaera borealis]
MSIHPMYRRWKSKPFAFVEAESPAQALELASRGGVDLTYADLRGLVAPRSFLPGADLRGVDLAASDLPGTYLRKADLRSATLVGANLANASIREADFRKADLRDADLRRADLRDARFNGADLRGVQLTGARLDGAVIDWRWSAFAVELLRRDVDCRGDAFRVVVELAFEDDDRPFGWLRTLVRKAGVIEWAFPLLGRAIAPGDNAPELLRRLAADTLIDAPTAAGPPASQHLWTRRKSLA